MQARVEYPRIATVIEFIADWLKHRSSHDLRYLPASEVDRIAADIGVSGWELRTLDDQPDRPLLLLRMLQALGLDQAARSDPLIFRDLQRSCAMCDCKKRCDRELADGTAASHFAEFCPNALTLKALA